MSNVRTPTLHPVRVIAVAALGFALSTVSAQQAAREGAAPPRARIAAVGQPANPPVLNPRHPDTYVVQRGDTLWDIAAMFLRDPWYWPEIWQINPQVLNPHLIYPGDILALSVLDDGSPVVSLSGNVERLSPRVRAEPLEEAIPTIPYEVLRAFLTRPSVIDESELEQLPYIVAHREGVLSAAGNDVYVRGTNAEVGDVYNVVHVGEPLIDPDDDAVLGYEGIYVGQGRVRRTGDPTTLRLTDSAREALVGDYLLQNDEMTPVNFFPRPPESNLEGSIISILDGISAIGEYQVAVINRGARHGLEPGHVLIAYQAGEEVVDEVRSGGRLRKEKVRLPDEPEGTMMIFSVYDRMSYALVMEATNEIAVFDTVRNP
jgi:LysM repeat protein